jgi:S1-C subfamily serine protease
MMSVMRTQALASLSLVVTGIACGASMTSLFARHEEPTAVPALPSSALSPVDEPQDPLRNPTGRLAANADEASLRMTPIVKAVSRAADSVVSIHLVDMRTRSAEGQGSGVILDENGLVITNWHVVWQALIDPTPFALQARLKDDERAYAVRVLSSSAEDDLALLQLDLPKGQRVKPIVLGDSDSLMIGESLIAIGNPRGHANTVTAGVLSAEERSITVRAPDGQVRRYEGLLQTDAAINQGNSGGALLDITGKLIGINNAMAVSAENIGFAIPVNTVKRVFQETLLSSDNLASVWLGLRVAEHDGEVVVSEVEPLGPAARAGVRQGDRLLAVSGEGVQSSVDFARQMLQARPGERVPLQVQRSGRKLEVEPVPLSQLGFELVRRLGIEVETITYDDDPELVRQATERLLGGYSRRAAVLSGIVRITRVYPGAAAQRLDAEEGDILLGFSYQDWWGDWRDAPFVSEADLADKARIHAGRAMHVLVLRGDKLLEGTLHVAG